MSPLVSSDVLFYCSDHPETDSAAIKRLDWSLSPKFGEDCGKTHAKKYRGVQGTGIWGAPGLCCYWEQSQGELERASVQGSSGLCYRDGTYVVYSSFASERNPCGETGLQHSVT